MPRLLLLAWLLLGSAALPGCGLFSHGEPIGFRTYTLKDVSYGEGVEIVDDAVRRFAVGKFGGVGITLDVAGFNLELDPVYEDRRRMKLFIHFVPRPPDLDLEMLALVEHLESGERGGQVGWLRPQMDVPLEQDIYQAILQELLARRAAAPLP